MKKKFLLSGALLLFCFMQSFAQQRTITGTVTTKDGTPLSGASVVVVGRKTGETTASNGSFSINVPENTKELKISYVGYETQTMSVTGQSNISVSLQASANNLNEIVVTGYTSQLKKDITGAVATVNVTDARKIPSTSSEQLLQGQAAGVTVINSGAPGAASTVFVRGISNFGHTQPLYVIDGVQTSDMSTVNPNDIESISVLKDAGAAAIYGISGGNGVVVVTTKKGHGKSTISYDAFYGTQLPLSGNVWHLMNPEQQSELAFRAGDKATEALYPGGPGVIPTYGYHGPAGSGGAFGYSGVTNDPGILQYYNFDKANPGNDFLIQKFATGSGTDWFHSVFKAAPQQQHTLTASGGNDKSNYLFSLNYVDQKGTLLNNYEKRYAVRLNTNFNVKNHIRFGENGFVTYKENNGGYNGTQQQEGGGIAFTYRLMPIIPVFDVKGNYGGTYDGPNGEPLGNGQSPYAIQNNQATNNAHFVLVEGNIFAEADIAKDFTLRTSIGGNLYNQYYWNLAYNPYQDYESHGNPNGNSENEQMSSNYNWTNTITFKKTFGKHDIQAFAGYELKAFAGREFHAQSQNFFSLDPNFVLLQYGTSVVPPYGSIYQPNSTESFFGQLNYIYNDKYILGATIRRDGFSIFYPGRQWGTFPSVSLGWRVSQEDFMKNISWINSLKLRASYGEAGNNGNIGGNNAYSSYSQGAGASFYPIGGGSSGTGALSQGFYQNQIGNPFVTWETDKITNVGLDAALFNHLDFTVEWYKKATSGLLFPQPLNNIIAPVGVNVPTVNIGDVQNTGVDISANYHANVGKDFSFNIGANVSAYKSLVTKIPTPGYFDVGGVRALNSTSNVVRNQVGHPIGEFFGYQTAGIYQDTTSAKSGATYSGASAGSFIYKDVSGPAGKPDGKIDANDRTWIGNPNPKFTYGVNLSANYKRFDFTMILYGSYGNKDFNYTKYWTDFYSTFQGGKSIDLYNKAAIVVDGKVTNPGATLPAASFSQDLGSSAYSSFYIENGSFLKCRVAQLGYTIDPQILKRIGVDKFHVYFQATNLFMITKYTGLDPELVPSLNVNGSGNNQSAAFGIDYGAYPNNQKQYILGVDLTF
ncbi:MAG TPA: TonB-dependent receptor [Hanamia sp.]